MKAHLKTQRDIHTCGGEKDRGREGRRGEGRREGEIHHTVIPIAITVKFAGRTEVSRLLKYSNIITEYVLQGSLQ